MVWLGRVLVCASTVVDLIHLPPAPYTQEGPYMPHSDGLAKLDVVSLPFLDDIRIRRQRKRLGEKSYYYWHEFINGNLCPSGSSFSNPN